MSEFLLLYFIKSTLILLLAILTGSFFLKNSAHRSFLYRLGFIAVLILPVLSILMPRWDYFVGSLLTPFQQLINPQPTITEMSLATGEPATSTSFNLSTVLLIVWLSGVAIMLLRIVLGKIHAVALSRKANIVEDPEINTLIDKASDQLKIRKSFKVKLSSEIGVPFVEGIFKSTVILPDDFINWPEPKQEMVLYHELAHIKRADTLWYMLSSFAVAIHWFNPFFWFSRKQMMIATEINCDSYVIASGFNRNKYAEYILLMTKNLNKKLFLSPVNVAMAKRNQLEGRLMSILSVPAKTLKPSAAFITVTFVIILSLLLPLSGISPLAADKKADQKKEQKEKLPGVNDFVEVTAMPELVESTVPEYPKELMKKNVEGVVWVKALILKSGFVDKAVVFKTSGEPALDESALAAAYKNRYKPAMQKDKAVACWVSYKVVFSLGEK